MHPTDQLYNFTSKKQKKAEAPKLASFHEIVIGVQNIRTIRYRLSETVCKPGTVAWIFPVNSAGGEPIPLRKVFRTWSLPLGGMVAERPI